MRRALLFLLCWALGGCESPLLEGLDEPSANDLVARLAEVDIAAEKVGRGARFTVSVPRARWTDAWQIARRSGWPRAESRPPPTRLIALPDERAADARARRGEALARALKLDPGTIDADIVLGAGGAVVTLIRAPESAAIDEPGVAAQVRVGADLPTTAEVVITAHIIPRPSVDARPQAAQPTRALALASSAVGLMGVACALAWRRRRR